MVVPAETRRTLLIASLMDPFNPVSNLENQCFLATTSGTLKNRVGEPLVRLQLACVNYQPIHGVSSLYPCCADGLGSLTG
ncbi:MAG: hypothetical protein JWP89_2531 [Schlesneria sp.]|nr:hypothetical protein [Schlesneria sp.]